jgi:hypothetical protein
MFGKALSMDFNSSLTPVNNIANVDKLGETRSLNVTQNVVYLSPSVTVDKFISHYYCGLQTAMALSHEEVHYL